MALIHLPDVYWVGNKNAILKMIKQG